MLPAMAHNMAACSWVQPLCETGATVAHMANSLWVTVATSLVAEVRAGDWRRAKRTAAVPVEFETQPTVFGGKVDDIREHDSAQLHIVVKFYYN